MIILIAPDSFKGTLTAREAAEIIGREARALPGCRDVLLCPIADGGEGTADVLTGPDDQLITTRTVDPLGRPITCRWPLAGDRAVIEVAMASGLGRVKEGERRPLVADTRGTGLLIKDAVARGCKRIVVGLGGSATVDGGRGLLEALGARFSPDNREVDLEPARKFLAGVEVIGACDVDNPLLGPDGAAPVFGPQKGAAPGEVRMLEQRLSVLARAYERASGQDLTDIKGAGAAGGVGAALAAVGARLVSGVDFVLEQTGFEQLLGEADLVVTGEGRLDRQTTRGKAVAGVCRWAESAGVPVIGIVGSVGDLEPVPGLLAVFDATTEPGAIPDAGAAARRLAHAARQVFTMMSWCIEQTR